MKSNPEHLISGNARFRRVAYTVMGLVLFLIFLFRFHLRNIPLERDEGEYAYAGQLLLQGIPPYELAYNMKLPGTYAAYAVIMSLFGQTPAGVHFGVLIVNLATVFLIFLLAQRLFGIMAGALAAASYALLSVSPSVLGFSAHATHFVVLAAVAGILVLLHAIDKPSTWLIFSSGVLLGLAFVMKQPGLLFIIFAGLYLLAMERRESFDPLVLLARVGAFSAGALLPFAITCVLLWRAGVFSTFWFWTVSYASQYASNWGLDEGAHLLSTVFPAVVGPCLWLWLLGVVGLTAVFWGEETRNKRLFLLGFLLFSFLAVCPGLLFREHYFILMLPAISLLIGVGVSAGTAKLIAVNQHRFLEYLPTALFIFAIAGSFYRQKDFFLEANPTVISRRVYGGNPFPEAIPISDYIRQHTPENARIAVLGSEPEIYFYAHRHSATGYIYTYALMEEQKYAAKMQEQMISEIQSTRPEALVFVNVPASWLPQPHSQTLIYSWAQKYIKDEYELVGVADIHMGSTDYRWDGEAKTYKPRSNSVVFVFRRKTS